MRIDWHAQLELMCSIRTPLRSKLKPSWSAFSSNKSSQGSSLESKLDYFKIMISIKSSLNWRRERMAHLLWKGKKHVTSCIDHKYYELLFRGKFLPIQSVDTTIISNGMSFQPNANKFSRILFIGILPVLSCKSSLLSVGQFLSFLRNLVTAMELYQLLITTSFCDLSFISLAPFEEPVDVIKNAEDGIQNVSTFMQC